MYGHGFGYIPDDRDEQTVNQDGDPRRAVHSIDDDDDGPDDNYECVICGATQHIDDEYQSTAPAWCDSCGTVRDHWHIEKHE